MRFNSRGSRLLCREKDNISLLPFKVSTDAEMNKVLHLSSPGYCVPKKGFNVCCFAGGDDDLIVASSAAGDHSLHIWSTPDRKTYGAESREFNQSILTLHGLQKSLESVRYSKAISTLATCGKENVIKLWTPTT